MILEKKIPLKYWINLIKWEMLSVTILSLVTHYVSRYVTDVRIPISIGAFLGTAIALVLSFRLSQSYDRWWEARKIWGDIVNNSRSLVIQLKNFLKEGEMGQVRVIAFRQIAWCYALGQGLRNLEAIENIEGLVGTKEMQDLKEKEHIPLALLDNHSKDIADLYRKDQINAYQEIQLDTTLLNLCACMGKAERIKKTEFPKTYRITLKLFIYIFLILLSFSLAEASDIPDIPILLAISIPFFLLEKISFQIQDPFENQPTDTPVTSIARTIEKNLKQLVDENEMSVPPAEENFYEL